MYKVSTPMGLIYEDLKTNKVFLLGLLFKIILLYLLVPVIHIDWFGDFFTHFFSNPTIDPWSSYLLAGGERVSFPYGPLMFLFILPFAWLGWLLDTVFISENYLHLGISLSVLFADLLLLIILLREFNEYKKKIYIFYWLSPIAIFISYWHGQLDIIPIMIFFISLIYLKKRSFFTSGILAGVAFATKHIVLLALPFILLHLWSNRNIFRNIKKYIVGLVLVIATEALFIFSQGFTNMVIFNQESEKIFFLSIDLGNTLKIYIIPVLFLSMMYFFWRIRKANFDLLLSMVGFAFGVVIFLSPSPLSWYLWLIPFYVIHILKNQNTELPYYLFSLCFVALYLVISKPPVILMSPDLNFAKYTYFINSELVNSIIYSLMICLGFLILNQIFRDGLRHNIAYRLGSQPLSFAVGSNSQKYSDRFSLSVASLFGKNSTIEISDKSYLRWPKGSLSEQSLSIFNPRFFKLSEMYSDFKKLISGKKIKIVNTKEQKVDNLSITKSTSVLIMNSFFSLHSKSNKSTFDLSCFIKTSDFSLNELPEKMQYTINDYSKLEKQYIENFDVEFLIDSFETKQIDHHIKSLTVKTKEFGYYESLIKGLVGICGLDCRIKSKTNNSAFIEFEISGDAHSKDIYLVSKIIAPNLLDIVDIDDGFICGYMGVIQLIILAEINYGKNVKDL